MTNAFLKVGLSSMRSLSVPVAPPWAHAEAVSHTERSVHSHSH